MIYAPTNRRVIRPYDKPSFEHTQRYGLIKDHTLGPGGGNVLFLLFNEGSGGQVIDLSGNGSTGIITGLTWVPGKYGATLNFDGNGGYIDLGTFTNLDGVNALTVIMSIYPKELPFDSWNHAFFTRATGAIRAPWIYGNNALNNVSFNIHTTVGGYKDGNLVSDNLTINSQNHLVFGWNGVDVYSYLNGTKGSSTDTTTGNVLSNTDGHNYIGALQGPASEFKGLMDYFFIYNRALSASEIALLYREPFCMVRRKATPVYFFVPTGGVTYQELNLTITADANATTIDTHQMIDTGKAVQADAAVTESDTQQMVETGKAVEAAGTVSCTDLKVVFELNLEVTASGSVAATDAHTMIETGKVVTAIATPAVIESQTMVETGLGVSADANVSCTDTMGLLAHIAAFMVLRQCT